MYTDITKRNTKKLLFNNKTFYTYKSLTCNKKIKLNLYFASPELARGAYVRFVKFTIRLQAIIFNSVTLRTYFCLSQKINVAYLLLRHQIGQLELQGNWILNYIYFSFYLSIKGCAKTIGHALKMIVFLCSSDLKS